MWMTERATPAPTEKGSAHLLSNYDEYFIGHRDRSAIGNRFGNVDPVSGGDARITHVVIVGGELVGKWRRTVVDGKPSVALSIETRLSRAEQRLVDGAREKFEAFVA
jgi:hypothetical protein